MAGDEWLASGRTVVMAVPSVVVPREWNYMINLLHPDFRNIHRCGPEFTPFDRRLIRE
ncbi:MAG: hypothetical protein ACNA8K_04060 [Cyclonatronaceae bacterium]